jgi:hypothetical protein
MNCLKTAKFLKEVSNNLKKQTAKFPRGHELDPQYEILEDIKIEIPKDFYGIEYEGGDNKFGIIKSKNFFWQGSEDESPSKKEIEVFKEKLFLNVPEAVNSLIKHIFQPTINKIVDPDDFFLSKAQVIKKINIDYINITFGNESIKDNVLYVKDFFKQRFCKF